MNNINITETNNINKMNNIRMNINKIKSNNSNINKINNFF